MTKSAALRELHAGADERTGLLAHARRDGSTYEVALADLEFDPVSERGLVVAAYRRWRGRPPHPRATHGE